MLDTGPLGEVTHPKANREVTAWLSAVLRSGHEVVLSEIVDYELRRELLRAGKTKSLKRLNQLKANLRFIAIDSPTMLQAASYWAQARRSGRPTAHPHALDGDVILAAQARRVDAIVATENVGHLDQFVEVRKWSDLLVE